MKISWVTIDRFCQEEADAKEDVRRELERTGRPLRSSAGPLSDDELLAKLRDFGLDVDRDGVAAGSRGRAVRRRGGRADRGQARTRRRHDGGLGSGSACSPCGRDGGRTGLAWNSWTTRCRRATPEMRRTIRTRLS